MDILVMELDLIEEEAFHLQVDMSFTFHFRVDVSFSAHIDNKKKYILVLGIGPTQRLEHT